MGTISIKITNDLLIVLLGSVELVALASSPKYRERVDRKAITTQFKVIYDAHKEEIDRFADMVAADGDAHGWQSSPPLREKLIAFRDKHDGCPQQLPHPPAATDLEGKLHICVDEFIEWCKPYQLRVSSAKHIHPSRMTPFNWMGHALRWVRMLKRTKVREFTVHWNEKQMVLHYPNGKVVLPIDGKYAPGRMDFLFRSYVEDVHRCRHEVKAA